MLLIHKLFQIKNNKLSINAKFYKIFFACLILTVLNGYFFSYIRQQFFPNLEKNPLEKHGVLIQFIAACIIAPLVETLIFQSLLNLILNKIGIKNLYILICIPSIIFGLNHLYNPLYMISTFTAGLVMNLLYLFCLQNGKNAYFYVALLHFLYNFYGFTLSNLLQYVPNLFQIIKHAG